MTKVAELLVEAQKGHDEEVALLHLVISVLALVPEYIEKTQNDLQHAYITGDESEIESVQRHLESLRGSLRVAKLYANPTRLNVLNREQVTQFLSDGLA